MTAPTFRDRHNYRFFCQAEVVDKTPDGPMLALCGVGYANKWRKKNKKCGLCGHHLRVRIARDINLGHRGNGR